MNLLKALCVAVVLSFTSPVLALEVNINTDSAATLAEGLKGVGMKKAEAIVQYRKDNGNFSSLDELLNVPGIGEKTLDKNREKVKLSKK